MRIIESFFEAINRIEQAAISCVDNTEIKTILIGIVLWILGAVFVVVCYVKL